VLEVSAPDFVTLAAVDHALHSGDLCRVPDACRRAVGESRGWTACVAAMGRSRVSRTAQWPCSSTRCSLHERLTSTALLKYMRGLVVEKASWDM
jgi:hypothetical protein